MASNVTNSLIKAGIITAGAVGIDFGIGLLEDQCTSQYLAEMVDLGQSVIRVAGPLLASERFMKGQNDSPLVRKAYQMAVCAFPGMELLRDNGNILQDIDFRQGYNEMLDKGGLKLRGALLSIPFWKNAYNFLKK